MTLKQEDRVRVVGVTGLPVNYIGRLGTVQPTSPPVFSAGRNFYRVKIGDDAFVYLYAEDELEKVEE